MKHSDIDKLSFESPTVADNERFDRPKARGNFRVPFCARSGGTKEYAPCGIFPQGCEECFRFSAYIPQAKQEK